jgi:hypothetical protein
MIQLELFPGLIRLPRRIPVEYPAILYTEDDDPWVIAGRENGYPECCIAFWCGEWQSLVRADVFDDAARAQEQVYWDRCQSAGLPGGYIPCPGCLEAIERGEMIPPVVKWTARERAIRRKQKRRQRANRAARAGVVRRR